MTSPGPAAYSLYDILRSLCEKHAWPSEADRNAAINAVNAAEAAGVLGQVAQRIECRHDGQLVAGRCPDCGRTIEVGKTGAIPAAPYHIAESWR